MWQSMLSVDNAAGMSNMTGRLLCCLEKPLALHSTHLDSFPFGKNPEKNEELNLESIGPTLLRRLLCISLSTKMSIKRCKF